MGKKKSDGGAGALLDESRKRTDQALEEFENIDPLRAEQLKYEIDIPRLVGMLEAEGLDASAMEDVSTDPRLRDSQMGALESLEKIAEGGIDAEDLAMLDLVKRQSASQNQAQQSSILQDMAQRGMGGSGSELAARLQASQNTANMGGQNALQIAAENLQAKRDALSRAGSLASGIESKDFQQQQSTAQAVDAINRANWANRQDVQNRNLTQQQQMANMQSQMRTAQRAQDVSATQGAQDSAMQLAGNKAGVLTGQAQMLQNQATNAQKLAANQKPGMGSAMLSGAGQGAAAGAMTGNPYGVAIGAGVGALAGGMSSQMADGGIARKKKLDDAMSKPSEFEEKIETIQYAADGGVMKKTVKTKKPSYQNGGEVLGFRDKYYEDKNQIINPRDMVVSKPSLASLVSPRQLETPVADRFAAESNANMDNMLTKDTKSSSMDNKALALAIAKAAKGLTEDKASKNVDLETIPVSFDPINAKYEDGGVATFAKSIKGFSTGNLTQDNNDSGLQWERYGTTKDLSDVFGSDGMSSEELDYFKEVSKMEDAKFANGGTARAANGDIVDKSSLKNFLDKRTEELDELKRTSPRQYPLAVKSALEESKRLRPQAKAIDKAESMVGPAVKKKSAKLLDKLGKMKVAQKVAKKAAKTVGKKGLKSIPVLGPLVGLASALESGDASAAIPILNEAENLGPQAGSLEYKLESGEQLSPEEMALLENRMKCGGIAKKYEDGGMPIEMLEDDTYDSDIDGEVIETGEMEYADDRVDAKVNEGEMVVNLPMQQNLLDVARGKKDIEELPDDDIVRPATLDETNVQKDNRELKEENEELKARLEALGQFGEE